VNHFLYFFQIFKEPLIGKSQYQNLNGLNMGSCFDTARSLWRVAKSKATTCLGY
jgi:hypothetical protein